MHRWISAIKKSSRRQLRPLTFLALAGLIVTPSVPAQEPKSDARVNALMAHLWSADPQVATLAKDDIRRIGESAVPFLLSELDRITRTPEAPGYPVPTSRDGGLTQRVTKHICELLVEFPTVEAVPLLIRVMERKRMTGLFEHYTVDMFALAKIGAPAVPALVSEIQNIGVKLTLEYALAGQQNTMAGGRISRVQENAAATLGLIGDPGALPALEALLYTTGNGMLARTVEAAIESIRAKWSNKARN